MSNETDEDFCERVRSAIAYSLGATLSPINAEHLADVSVKIISGSKCTHFAQLITRVYLL